MMFFRLRYRYLYVLLLALYTYLNTELCQVYTYFQIEIHWYNAFGIIFLITLLTWEWNRWLLPVVQKIFPGTQNLVRQGVLFFFFGLAMSYISTIAVDLLFAKFIVHQEPDSILNPLKLTLIYASLINLLFHLLNLLMAYKDKLRAKELEAEELKRMHAQAELVAIKNQVNPHFLFNNLNVLSGLVMEKSADANRFIEAFSKVYMHILSSSGKELIELRRELDFMEPYFFLLQQRFPGSLQVSIEVPGMYYNHYIIPVALQMLVENAIKHNIFSQKKPLTIRIYANGNSTVSVINNLQPRVDTAASSQIGLNNIRKRYQLTAGMDIVVEQTANLFSVQLPLIQVNSYESINN